MLRSELALAWLRSRCFLAAHLQFGLHHPKPVFVWVGPALTRRPPTVSTPEIQYLLALVLEGFIHRATLGCNRWDKPWSYSYMQTFEAEIILSQNINQRIYLRCFGSKDVVQFYNSVFWPERFKPANRSFFVNRTVKYKI